MSAMLSPRDARELFDWPRGLISCIIHKPSFVYTSRFGEINHWRSIVRVIKPSEWFAAVGCWTVE